MKAVQDIPFASRWAILNKNFNVTEEEVRKTYASEELEEQLALLPTEEEQKWMKIWTSKAKGLGRIQRKMAVCIEVEVKEIGPGYIIFEFEDKEIKILNPKNIWKISAALEFSKSHAVAEMFVQGCVLVDGIVADMKKTDLEIDELQSIFTVMNLFFFQIYR